MDPWPSPALLPEPSGRRVAIVSGSYGAGHDAAAAEIARHLAGVGCEISTYDVARLLPVGVGHLLKRAYYAQLRRCPSTWETTLSFAEQGRLLHRCALRAMAAGAPRLARATSGHDLVVATHPFAGLALGNARVEGLLRVPVATYLTDLSVHALWVHPGVDLHLAIHEVAARQARARGGRTVTVQPVVRSVAAVVGDDPLAAYEIERPVALITGGSLGIGALERAAADVVATGAMTPVVACGHNDGLRRRLETQPGVVALGWRDDLPAVIAASDCVVQNAGGFTSLEALAAGTPVVTYLPIPGHGVTNALALEEAGLAPWPRDVETLGHVLTGMLTVDRRDRLPHDAPTLVDVLTGSAACPAQAAAPPVEVA